MLGGTGDDILVGGTEQFVTPNSDVMIGGPGDDVAIWRQLRVGPTAYRARFRSAAA